jgi:hypothetical protein
MTMDEKDVGEISAELEVLRKRVAPGAEALQDRFTELGRRISAFRGSFLPGPGDLGQIRAQFLALKQDMPVLEELYAAAQQTRAVVLEFRSAPPLNRVVDERIGEWSKEWLELLDHIVRAVGDARTAGPPLGQVKQIRTWVRQRRQAANLIRNVNELASQGGDGKNPALAGVARAWTEQFRQGHIDEDWLEESRTQFELLRKEFPPAAPTMPPPGQAPIEPAATPSGETANTFHIISQALAECRDLAQALHLEGSEIPGFERRRLDVQNDRDEAVLQALLRDIEAFQGKLREQASEEKEKRLQLLQLRWRQFQSIYKDDKHQDTAELIRRAEASRPDSGIGLDQFFERVREALNKIYFTAEGNRSRLTAAVERWAEARKAQHLELRRQPRTLALDAALAQQEKRVPLDLELPLAAEDSFERLDEYSALVNELRLLQQKNEQDRSDLAARADRLRNLAASIADVEDAPEAAAAREWVKRLSTPPGADTWLDETAAALNRAEKTLDGLLTLVLDRTTAELLKLRKENQDWVRLVVEFYPEADAFVVRSVPPREVEQLRAAADLEAQHQQKIAALVALSVQQLATRREDVCRHLRDHLASPAFETHPERERAEELLSEVELLPPLSESPTRAGFMNAYNVIGEAESFVDKLESERRRIPGEVKGLVERFDKLNELNVVAYRRNMANRVKALLSGMQKGIAAEQFEPLKTQLDLTDALIKALEADIRSRVTLETEQLVKSLNNAMETSTDKNFVLQAQSALEQLQEEGHLESPSYFLRQRLSRALRRGPSAKQEVR